MERLKGKVDALIVQMENTLATNPTTTFALQTKVKHTEKAWTEFENQYDRLHAIAGENQAEQDRTHLVTLQRRYFEVLERAEDALVNEQNAEDVRLKALASEEEARLKELKNAEDVRLKALNSEQKVQQYTARWKGVHHRIEKSLEEIKASLEGDAIGSLEVLKVKEDRLMQVKESLKESASLVVSIIIESTRLAHSLRVNFTCISRSSLTFSTSRLSMASPSRLVLISSKLLSMRW